jgi:hypothetical protein
MALNIELVALEEFPVNSTKRGYARRVISLLEKEEAIRGFAGNLGQPNSNDLDYVQRDTLGSLSRVQRIHARGIKLALDKITTLQKRDIELLRESRRPVYFCPNIGRHTTHSFPFTRSEKSLINAAPTVTRGGNAYVWDEREQVMQKFSANKAAMGFNGHYSRYLRTTFAQANFANRPHPTSAGVGWTLSAGSGSAAYSSAIASPVLAQSNIGGQEGVAVLEAQTSATKTVFDMSATGLSTTLMLVGSVVIRGYGQVIIYLYSSATPVAASVVTLNGNWQLVKLYGQNLAASTNASIKIEFQDVDTGANQYQCAAQVGPVLITNGNESTAATMTEYGADWVDTSAVGAETLMTTDDEVLGAENTVSFITRWSLAQLGFFYLQGTNTWKASKTPTLGSPADALRMQWGDGIYRTFSTISASVPGMSALAVGDWIHVAFVQSRNVSTGISSGTLYVNGQPHATPITNVGTAGVGGGTNLIIGRAQGVGQALNDSGLSMFRIDNVAWSPQEVLNHYHTYFSNVGRGVVEPMFGREFSIEHLALEPDGFDNDGQRWSGDLELEQSGINLKVATQQVQEEI